MPDAVTQLNVAEKPSQARDRATGDGRFRRSRAIFFLAADFVFLILAGIAATLAMHIIHQFEWPFVLTCLLGMVAAMLIQTLVAFAAAPLLGSIESMVPSMIVAMVSPMTICVLHLLGCESTSLMAVLIGIAFAIGVFLFVQLYGRACGNVLISDRAFGGG